MKQLIFKDLFDVAIAVANNLYDGISEEDRRKHSIFIPDLQSDSNIRSNIRLKYDSHLKKVNVKDFFNNDEKIMMCIKIASLCEAILSNKIICYVAFKGTSTEIMMLNYRIALESVLENLLICVKEELGFEHLNQQDKLLYPAEDFEDLLLLSLIINDNTRDYKFDILTFASMILLLYEYNIEKCKAK